MQPSALIPEHLITPKNTLAVTPHSSLTLVPSNHEPAFSLYGFTYSGLFIKKESYNMWPLRSDCFHFSIMFLRLIHVDCILFEQVKFT